MPRGRRIGGDGMETVIAATVSGLAALAGTVLTCLLTSRKTEQNIRVNQAVTDTKIEELTREVREHNNFARRMPVVEERVRALEHRIVNMEEHIGRDIY